MSRNYNLYSWGCNGIRFVFVNTAFYKRKYAVTYLFYILRWFKVESRVYSLFMFSSGPREAEVAILLICNNVCFGARLDQNHLHVCTPCRFILLGQSYRIVFKGLNGSGTAHQLYQFGFVSCNIHTNHLYFTMRTIHFSNI